jgi:hypothetical protein
MKNPKTLIIALISSLLGSGISLIAEKPLSPPSIEGLDYVKPVPRLDGERFGKVNLNESLLAHYSFDGHAQDSSGNQNHATSEGVTATQNRFGHESNAFAFDRDYVLTPDFSKILDNELTVCGWLYRDSDSKAIEQVFEALTNVWEIFLETVNSQNGEVLRFNHSGEKRYKMDTDAIPADEWFHFASVIDSERQAIFINGNLVKSVPHSGPLGVKTAFRIGRDYEGKFQFWKGAMDDFRIYDRGLNEYEIEALYKDTSDMVDLEAGLVGHYPFSGNPEDQSGNNNHLENKGATLTQDRFGMENSAYAFDGTSSHLFADIENRKGDFSLSLWAKANDVEQSRYRSVINIHDKTPGSRDTCQIHTSGGRYPTYQFFSSNPESFALVTQEWQHLAVTVLGNVIRFYENGERVYSQELEGGEANSFSNIIIGKNRHGGRKYNGNIDDVYIYNRAINDAEVARLFDGGLEDSDGDGLTDDYEVGKSRYKLIAGSYDWRSAKSDAESRGGHLATITSQAEWEAVKNTVGELPNTYWLGGTDEKTEGTWEWITGEVWKFTKWAKNEPNNLGNEDYLQTWGPSLDGNRAWNDNQFNENRNGYILEYGYYSNPNSKDSDGDGYDDGKEVLAKTDPNNPFSRPMPNITAPKTGPGAPPAPDYVETISKLTDKVLEHEIENQKLQESNAALLVDVAELNSTNEILVSQVGDLEAEVGKLESKVEDLDTQVAVLTEKNQVISTQLQNVSHERNNLVYQMEVKDEQLEEAVRVAQTPFINGWVYDNDRGWMFTDSDHYPLVYTHSDQSWNYYELGSSEPRYFFNFTSQQWEAWDALPEEKNTDLADNQNL